MSGVVLLLALGGAAVAGCGGESMRAPSNDDHVTGGTAGTSNVSRGGTGNATGAGMGGRGATGGVGCDHEVVCHGPDCPDGNLVPRGCELCPECSCEDVACTTVDCPDGARPILRDGYCCPTCPSPDLEACETDADCTLATSELVCCDCPGAYTESHVRADRCMNAVGDAPKVDSACSQACPPIPCGTCSLPPTGAACIRGRCEPTYVGSD